MPGPPGPCAPAQSASHQNSRYRQNQSYSLHAPHRLLLPCASRDPLSPSLVSLTWFRSRSYSVPFSSINCASGSIAAGTCSRYIAVHRRQQILILTPLRFRHRSWLLLWSTAALPQAVLAAARSCAAFCAAVLRRNPRHLLPVMALVQGCLPGCPRPARIPAPSLPPAASYAAAVFTAVRGRLYAASLQASTLALKFFSASRHHRIFDFSRQFVPRNSSCSSQLRAHSAQRSRKMRFHRALAQSGGLLQSRSTPAPQRSAAKKPFAAARSGSRPPSKPAPPVPAPASAALRSVRRSAAIRWPRPVHRVGLRVPPELQPPVAPVVLLQVDGNPHQPGHRARLAAKVLPVPVRLQEALLRQRLRQIHVPQRRQQKPENLRPMAFDDARKLLRSNLLRRFRGHRLYCCRRLPSIW